MNEGIELGHKVSKQGLEVDKVKIEVIEKLPPPLSVKGVRSFLDQAGFYRRFIKDFSKIIRAMCTFLDKKVKFNFDDKKVKFNFSKIITYFTYSYPPQTLFLSNYFRTSPIPNPNSNLLQNSASHSCSDTLFVGFLFI